MDKGAVFAGCVPYKSLNRIDRTGFPLVAFFTQRSGVTQRYIYLQRHDFVYSAFPPLSRSYRNIAPSKTCAPFPQSSGLQYSAGLWLTPSLQGTKILGRCVSFSLLEIQPQLTSTLEHVSMYKR